MKLAVILVHYRTPELARDACAALASDAGASGLELELLLVDNGSDPEDRALLDALPDRRIDPGRNLGYAGAINLGVRETTAERIVAMNPDVVVLPGCLRALGEALDAGAAAAAPRCYWDAGKRFLLPPTEKVSRTAELLRVLGQGSAFWARRGRKRWRAHARRHWLADEPIASHDLSGAILAFTRAAWHAVGPFDEGYRLYFEETDWLQRLRRARLAARYVPAAEAVHLYAQSTVGEPRTERWFADSCRRFRRRFYGAFFTRLLERLSARRTPAAPPATAPLDQAPSDAAWLEVSSSPLGYPAAARRLNRRDTETLTLPNEIIERLAPGRYFLRTVSAEDRELGLMASDVSGD